MPIKQRLRYDLRTHKNLSDLSLMLLANRGIVEPDEIDEFISETPRVTYDPFLLKDMEAAVSRIIEAVENGEKICIYGDYDADGVTSTAILLLYLSSIGAEKSKLKFYIPSRFDEGYGLNMEAIKRLQSESVDLIITVDCGVISVEEVAYAQEIGMEIIITDHHNVGKELPDCLVINPKQPGCKYPFKDLAGCGIAFKLVQALNDRLEEDQRKKNSLLDLVALGTIADVVPLKDENRTIVKYGLSIMEKMKRPSLNLLRKKLGQKESRVSSENISFGIAPSINAAGRMADATLGVNFLLTSKEEVLREKIDKILHLNSQRKKIQEEVFQTLLKEAERFEDSQIAMLVSRGGHEGVIGIVAGMLKDKLKKPVVVMIESEEEPNILKGSGRSFGKINIYDLFKKNENLFEKFGGHSAACGFQIKKSNLESLRRKTELEMSLLDSSCFEEEDKVEASISVDDASIEFIEELSLLEPFGKDNPNPVFEFTKVLAKDAILLSDGAHIKFKAVDDTGEIDCIFFRQGKEHSYLIDNQGPYTVRGKLSLNCWNNLLSPQMIVEEIL